MVDNRVGKKVLNKNGKEYTILAIDGDSAVLHGGHDFVVIRDLSYFIENGSWGGGKYFPCFNEEDSYKMLRMSLHYLKYREYLVMDDEDCE